jgi:hypothetical protein
MNAQNIEFLFIDGFLFSDLLNAGAGHSKFGHEICLLNRIRVHYPISTAKTGNGLQNSAYKNCINSSNCISRINLRKSLYQRGIHGSRVDRRGSAGTCFLRRCSSPLLLWLLPRAADRDLGWRRHRQWAQHSANGAILGAALLAPFLTFVVYGVCASFVV